MKRGRGQGAGENPAGITATSGDWCLAPVSCRRAVATSPAPYPLPRLC